MNARTSVSVGDRELSVSNLDKVLYPDAGFTKAQIIEYYVRIAPTMLPHIAGRGVTLKRFPDGVDTKGFFEKRCPSHRPEWIGVHEGPGDRGGAIGYCAFDEVAALAWSANMAALEIHSPMAFGSDIESPTMLVFDLDPGAPATIIECAQVGLMVRSVLESLDLESFAKTSGSKGMQMYVPLNTPHTHSHASDFALAVAQLLEKQNPKMVVSRMTKKLRSGKIFIDWSQNSRHKTTIAPYSLRARSRPTVSTPITWDEVSDCADGSVIPSFEATDVVERVTELGDLFAGTLELQQELPHAKG